MQTLQVCNTSAGSVVCVSSLLGSQMLTQIFSIAAPAIDMATYTKCGQIK